MSGSESGSRSASAFEITIRRRISGSTSILGDTDPDTDPGCRWDWPRFPGRAKEGPYGRGRLFKIFVALSRYTCFRIPSERPKPFILQW